MNHSCNACGAQPGADGVFCPVCEPVSAPEIHDATVMDATVTDVPVTVQTAANTRAGAASPKLPRFLQRALLVLLMSWAAVTPFVELRQIQARVPGYWSDFYSPWSATRAALHGQDPYSKAVTRQIQVWFYGHALTPAEINDTQAFVYPAHAILLFAPAAVLPWHGVRLLFSFLLPALVAASAWLWMEMCGMQLTAWNRVVLLVLITASWPSVWAAQQMQPTVLAFAAVTGACFLLRKQRDLAAGFLLAASTFKPNIVVPLIAWLIVWALIQRRGRFVAAFALSITGFLAAAEAILPGWIPRWKAAILTYSADVHKPPLLLFLFGRGGRAFSFGTVLLVIFLVCGALWRLGLAPANAPNFGRSAALILAFTACIIPGTLWMVYNQLLLIPGVFILLRTHPKGPPAKPARDLSLALASWAALGVPICVSISFILGSPGLRPVLPFLDILLPAAVTGALLCVGPALPLDAAAQLQSAPLEIRS